MLYIGEGFCLDEGMCMVREVYVHRSEGFQLYKN